jgi:hypothetical protein
MLLQREADAMLQPVLGSENHIVPDEDSAHIAPEALLPSVEDTLRLPMHLPTSHASIWQDRGRPTTTDKRLVLNESLASVQRGKAQAALLF